MKIIVVGANGQLGWELLRTGVSKGLDMIPLDLPHFDITDRSQIEHHVQQPNVALVINASAYTAVDRAESEKDLAFAVNRDGPFYLADACKKMAIPLIHVSTDYVFDGNSKRPYCETDPICPLGVYGKSKAEGEDKIRDCLEEHIILRTAWLYGVWGNNFVKTIIRLGKEQDRLRIVADQRGCPTYAADLANAILIIVERFRQGMSVPWGTYHYCGRGEISWHGFAEKIIEFAGRYIPIRAKEIDAITTADYPVPAKRPAWSVLDCSLIETQFDIYSRAWQDSLREMIDCLFRLENEKNAF